MRDYSKALNRLFQALAAQVMRSPSILNSSPHSLAWKIDPYYYIAQAPKFVARWAAWASMRPGHAAETLLLTGTMVSRKLPSGRKTTIPVSLVCSGGTALSAGTPAEVQFFLVDAMDRALRLHGIPAMPISTMRIDSASRSQVAALLEGKTQLASAGFTAK